MELVVHKGYESSDDQLFKYGYDDMESMKTMHDTMGCLLSHEGKIAYWRNRVERAKNAKDMEGMKIAVMILSKYIRGIYA